MMLMMMHLLPILQKKKPGIVQLNYTKPTAADQIVGDRHDNITVLVRKFLIVVFLLCFFFCTLSVILACSILLFCRWCDLELSCLSLMLEHLNGIN